MPAQKSNAAAGFLKKMQGTPFAKHVGEAAKKEINYGPEQLPAGIKAVCRITEIGLKEYPSDTKMKTTDGKSAAGWYYFYAKASIVEPETFVYPDGVERKIAGRHVTLQDRGMANIPCIAVKNKDGTKVVSQEEQCDKIMQELGKLTSPEFIADATFEQIPDLIEEINKTKPVFNFSTSVKAESKEKNTDGSPKYPAGVWENWNGNRGLENYIPPDARDANTDDQTGGGDTGGGDSTTAPTGDDQPDLDALVAAATDGDQEAIDKLTDMATAVGVEIGPEQDAPANTINGAPDWPTVKEWIEAGGAPEPEVEKAWEPTVKGVVKYKTFVDPKKGPKSAKKTFDCDVTAVNKVKKTVTLKNLTGGAIYKDVAWDEVEPA